MYAEFFAKSPLLALPLFSLVLFMAVFAMVVFRIVGARGRELERAGGRMPLADDGFAKALSRDGEEVSQ